MRIPQNATPDVQAAFREVREELDRLLTGNIDLRGRRLMNAGSSVDARDYVTRAELTGIVAPPISVSSGGGGLSGDIEDGTGKIARLDGSGTFSGTRTVTSRWAFSSGVTMGTAVWAPGGVSGVTEEGRIQLHLAGDYVGSVAGFAYGLRSTGIITPFSADSINLHFFGKGASTAASGAHAFVAQVRIVGPAITLNGTGTVTSAAGLHITNPPSAATNNYAIYVDSGLTRLSGLLCVADPEISKATPALKFTDSGGDDYSIRCAADAIYIRNVTDTLDVAWFFGGGLGTLNVGISGTDPGSGEADVRILTRATDVPTSAYNWDGTGAAPDGYFKEYNGTQAVVIPFWNT